MESAVLRDAETGVVVALTINAISGTASDRLVAVITEGFAGIESADAPWVVGSEVVGVFTVISRGRVAINRSAWIIVAVSVCASVQTHLACGPVDTLVVVTASPGGRKDDQSVPIAIIGGAGVADHVVAGIFRAMARAERPSGVAARVGGGVQLAVGIEFTPRAARLCGEIVETFAHGIAVGVQGGTASPKAV